MPKRVIITENAMRRLMIENAVEDVLKSRDFEKRVKELSKEAIKTDKEIEKKVRQIVAKTVNILFRTLWQRSNFYEDNIKNGSF